jgi:hypothetical protein
MGFLPGCLQMATLETAEKLLEDLRVASFSAAERELADVRQYAADQVRGPTKSCNIVSLSTQTARFGGC